MNHSVQTECSLSPHRPRLPASCLEWREDGKSNKLANECSGRFKFFSLIEICVWNNFVSWTADIKKLGVSLSSPLHNEITRGRSRAYYWESSWARIKQSSLSLSLAFCLVSRGRNNIGALIGSLNERLNCIPSFQSPF